MSGSHILWNDWPHERTALAGQMSLAKRRPGLILVAAFLQVSCAAARELSQVEPINISSGTVTGVVTDSVTGRPLVGAAVRLLLPTGEPAAGQTNSTFAYAPDGAYRFDTVRPGSYLVRASISGYDSVTVALPQVNAGERRSIAFRLPPRRGAQLGLGRQVTSGLSRDGSQTAMLEARAARADDGPA